MAADADFASKFSLVLKAYNLSRGRFAQMLGVDKSVVSRWASGVQSPTDHNLSLLTEAVARYKTDFHRADWDLPPAAFAARLGLDRPGDAPDAATRAWKEPKLTSADKPSIAVLPLQNMSGDREQEYFADGITEDIITALSKWRSFLVIARNSTFTYKGRNVDIRQVGRELGVRYALEGSVRKVADRVRITAQLIDATTAAHLWAERFDRELVDVFAIQNEISQHIAAVVAPELGRHEQRLSSAKAPTNLEAWDCLHRGMHLIYRFTKADTAAARPCFERAIELDPAFSRAHTSLAYTHQLDILHGYTADRPASIAELLRLAKRGVELDDDDSYAHMMLCFAYRWAGEHVLSVAEGRKAIEANPSDAWALATFGNSLDLSGQSREGLSCMARALVLTPRDPHAKFYLSAGARACLNNRDYAAAETWARKAIAQDPSHARAHLMLAAALGHLGRSEEGRAALDACERIQPAFATTWIAGREYSNPADNDHIADGLRKAGMELK
ncbi:MAG: helix-turn-helix domain-containing protein [Alphaproteobacteria bacterium]|nr:helix-turn-helix domain-containing protein [Alphaproteobacteria bacterium]